MLNGRSINEEPLTDMNGIGLCAHSSHTPFNREDDGVNHHSNKYSKNSGKSRAIERRNVRWGHSTAP